MTLILKEGIYSETRMNYVAQKEKNNHSYQKMTTYQLKLLQLHLKW